MRAKAHNLLKTCITRIHFLRDFLFIFFYLKQHVSISFRINEFFICGQNFGRIRQKSETIFRFYFMFPAMFLFPPILQDFAEFEVLLLPAPFKVPWPSRRTQIGGVVDSADITWFNGVHKSVPT